MSHQTLFVQHFLYNDVLYIHNDLQKEHQKLLKKTGMAMERLVVKKTNIKTKEAFPYNKI